MWDLNIFHPSNDPLDWSLRNEFFVYVVVPIGRPLYGSKYFHFLEIADVAYDEGIPIFCFFLQQRSGFGHRIDIRFPTLAFDA